MILQKSNHIHRNIVALVITSYVGREAMSVFKSKINIIIPHSGNASEGKV